MAMEQAYNHVENALAAALRHIYNYDQTEAAEKFLRQFPNFKP